MILQPNQPITTKGDRPSRELLEALQSSGRDFRASETAIAALNSQMLSVVGGLSAIGASVDGIIAELGETTDAGRDMITAPDAAAQTALLDVFTASAKGLAPAATARGFLRSDGAWTPGFEYGVLAADYVLTSTTASQQLFNWSASGALTLQTGVYRFRALIYLTGMDATSGNGTFSLLGAGTATIGRVLYHAWGADNSSPLGNAARTGSASNTVGSATNVLTAGAGTGMIADVSGVFDVTAAGTLIPSIALTTAAAATVMAGSFFECQHVGDTGVAASAGWS